jgi:hypothetical protein
MAEEEAAGHAAGKGLEAFTRKIGPFPVWVYGVGLALAIYLWRKKSGGTGQQTDPAGNVGTIDPATGYVYGSSQDKAGLAAQNSTSTDGSSGGTSGSTTAGQYADNSSWGRAAVNYLVGLGEDPTAANEAIQQYLSSQTLTPQQQAMVNLVIQGIGAPPQLPGPTGTPPPPVVTPPGGIVYATNPPSGLTVSGKTSSTLTLKWNASTNSTGYVVRYGRTTDATDGSVSVGSGTTTATIGGLTQNVLYHVRVQATPAKDGAAFASTTATTDKVATPGGGVTPPPAGGGGGGNAGHSYTVVHGDTLIGIGNKLHIDWHVLYNNNKSVIEAAARSHDHSSSDGGHWIFPGTVLHY